MIKKYLPFIIFIPVIASCAYQPANPNRDGYSMIGTEELYNRMQDGDITLINVHIPNEGNIPGTDSEIPFDEIEQHAILLPEDQSEPVYIYCRSDSMGYTASREIVEMGYKEVYNLEGGYVQWIEDGYPFDRK